ncbi:MAG: TonB-dependent receptor, partial [Longimicrobiales bacterium]
ALALCKLSVILFAGLVVFAMSPVRLSGQTTVTLEGRIVGKYTGPIAQAQISVVELTTGVSRQALSRATGEFRILGLNPGRYAVTVSAAGYQPQSRTVDITVGQRVSDTFQLEPGVATLEPIEVRSPRTRSVEIQRTSVSAPVLEQEIQHLPLNTRNVMDLAALAPGIRSFRPSSGPALPAAGALRSWRFINLYLDGVELKNLFDGNLVGWPQSGSPLPAEALKEFRVYLNPYDPQYARAAAYTISAETQRGTNELHGSAFGFFQNNNFVAASSAQQLLPDSTRNDFERQQVGFNLRGPIVKNRLFYATSYELSNARELIEVVPGRPAFDPGFWDRYAGIFSAPERNHTGMLRLTYARDAANTFDAIWSTRHLASESNFGRMVSHDAAGRVKESVNTINLRHRWLPSARLLNELSLQFVGWSHAGRPLSPGPAHSYPTLQIGRPQSHYQVDEKHFRLVNRLTVDDTRGTHLVKAGVEIERVAAAHNNRMHGTGTFVFNSETDSLPARAMIGVGFYHPESNRDARVELAGWVTGAYISDEWRPLPGLILNLGPLYDAEINTLNNHFTEPWIADPELSARPELERYLNRSNRKNDLDNLAPRVSLSWDVRNNARTFLRAGLGVTYDRVLSFFAFEERRTASWRTYTVNRPRTTDPDVLRQLVRSGSVTARPSFTVVDLDIEAPQNRQWSIGAGHHFNSVLAFNLDYVRQDMRHLFAQLNLNAQGALSSRYGNIGAWDDFARARYQALLAQVTYKPDPDMRLALAYTLADAKADWDVTNFAVPLAQADQFYVMQRISGDERHRFVLSGLAALPHGFRLSTIATVASPRPYRATDSTDVNRNDFREDDWIDGKRYLVPENKWENWYRNVDVRLTYQIPLFRSVRLSAVAEGFNIFNTVNHSDYSGIARTSNFRQPINVFATRQFQLGMRAAF